MKTKKTIAGMLIISVFSFNAIAQIAQNTETVEPEHTETETVSAYKPIEHYNGTISGNATIIITEENWTEDVVIRIHNKGNTDLKICISGNETNGCTSKGKVVKAGKTKTFAVKELGIPSGNFLTLHNLDLKNAGEWKVDMKK